MYGKKNLILAIVWLVIGIIIIVLGAMGAVTDSLSPFGAVFAVIGIAQIVRFIRYSRDETFRKKIDIAYSDERYAFIKNKALAWTAYISVLGMCVIMIVCRLIGKNEISEILGYVVCAELVIYYVAYRIIGKKN